MAQVVPPASAAADENHCHQSPQPAHLIHARQPLAALPIAESSARALAIAHEVGRLGEERLMAMWALHDQERAAEVAVAQAQREALATAAPAWTAEQHAFLREFD